MTGRCADRLVHLTGLLWLALTAHHALAHSFDPAVLDLRERAPGVFDVVWKVPPTMAEGAGAASERLAPELPVHCRPVTVPAPTDSNLGEPVRWRVDCGPQGLLGERVAVNGLDGTKLDVLVRITWQNGRTVNGALRSGVDEMVVPSALGPAGLAAGATTVVVVKRYGRAGIRYLFSGSDHLLFLLALLLLVDGERKLIAAIIAFAVGQSLAVALAILGAVTVPATIAGVLIASSSVLLALELTRSPDAPRTLSRRTPWAVAFGFGLLHGLGLANALGRIGLPDDRVGWGLLGFNLGVEVAQLVFVLAMLVLLQVWRRVAVSRVVARLVPAYAIGTLAMAAVFERIGQFWSHAL